MEDIESLMCPIHELLLDQDDPESCFILQQHFALEALGTALSTYPWTACPKSSQLSVSFFIWGELYRRTVPSKSLCILFQLYKVCEPLYIFFFGNAI